MASSLCRQAGPYSTGPGRAVGENTLVSCICPGITMLNNTNLEPLVCLPDFTFYWESFHGCMGRCFLNNFEKTELIVLFVKHELLYQPPKCSINMVLADLTSDVRSNKEHTPSDRTNGVLLISNASFVAKQLYNTG